jgi:hypothetical protein
MDSFYLIVISVALVFLILLLVSFGVVLSRGKAVASYPKNPPNCPDYWEINPNIDNNGKVTYTCTIPPQYTFSNIKTYDKGKRVIDDADYDAAKNTINFSSQNWGGSVGVCNKYKWASSNKIAWDGVTNISPAC